MVSRAPSLRLGQSALVLSKTKVIFFYCATFPKDVVRRLKQHFNAKFDEVLGEKEVLLDKINSLKERLRAVLSELRSGL